MSYFDFALREHSEQGVESVWTRPCGLDRIDHNDVKMHLKVRFYLRRWLATHNHGLVSACDRSMHVTCCFETLVSSPLIILKLCNDVDSIWIFPSSNNESSIICWCNRILQYAAWIIVWKNNSEQYIRSIVRFDP